MSSRSDEAYQFPEGITVPSSIDSSLLVQGDIVDLLRNLPPDRISAALDTYDYQIKKGNEIRNPKAYLRGILRGGSAGKYGLPSGVSIPSSITQSMLEDKDLIEILKQMSVRDTNSCFRDYDDQMRKKSGSIRNKNAYLLGIVKSGPHYSLPQGVVIPATMSLAMLQGELLETLQELPCAHINVAFGDYDEQIQRKGDSIRNKHGYLLGIVKRMKRTFEEEAADHVAAMQQKNGSSPSPNTLATGALLLEASSNSALSPQSAGAQQGTLNMVTESFVRVTNELVIERTARNDLESRMKIELNRRENSTKKVLMLMTELASEKEQRERSALEVQRLRQDLSFERSLRETAEEKVQMLEGIRDTSNMLQSQGSTADMESEQLRQLGLELSIERGLREKTERLLQTAENRIHDLNRELQYQQQRTQQQQQQLPFGSNWMGSQSRAPGSEDNKSGISELVSLSGFDPEAFGFKGEQSLEAHR